MHWSAKMTKIMCGIPELIIEMDGSGLVGWHCHPCALVPCPLRVWAAGSGPGDSTCTRGWAQSVLLSRFSSVKSLASLTLSNPHSHRATVNRIPSPLDTCSLGPPCALEELNTAPVQSM